MPPAPQPVTRGVESAGEHIRRSRDAHIRTTVSRRLPAGSNALTGLGSTVPDHE